MKNFIVPIDFSPESLNGLELAILFSKKKKINIQMVYVITSLTDYHPSTINDEHKFAKNRFDKLLSQVQPQLENDSTIRYIIKKGKVYREIVSQVDSYKNSVVSASTHGASGFEELFVGSTAIKVMSATDKPVFTVRKSPVPKSIKNIILPIKLHPDTRQKVPFAAEIAKMFGATVHVVTVSTKQNKRDLERLKAYSNQSLGYLKNRKVECISRTVIGDSLPVLTLNYAEAVDADLIVMMSSAIDRWNVFLGSYAQQMLNRSKRPLLSIKPRPKQLPTGFRTLG
ncbi:MAG: universal stress protein [Bacteroidales bacterium]|nr:universal stress protein [Bacteroidales bacterium]